MVPKICTIEDCDRPCCGRGWCRMHYSRWRRHGDPLAGGPFIDPVLTPEKFWSLIPSGPNCAEWPRGIDVNGYGEAIYQGAKWRAHRLAYRLAHGEIPDGMEIDHICHNRACVKPSHLRLATRKQNSENHPGAQSNSKSGVRGVYWNERRQRWHGQVCHSGKRITVPSSRSLAEVEAAVVSLRLQLFTHNDRDRVPA